MAWDIKSSFAWGLKDEIQPIEPYETESLHFNPFVDLYGYWFGEWWAENEDAWWVKVNFIIEPFNLHLIDVDLSLDSSASPTPWNFCANIGFKEAPVHLEANIAWGVNNCSWGLIEQLANGKKSNNGCKMTYFGQGYGNDTPLW